MPIRVTGALAFNTSGNREEAVGYIVNGVTTNNLTFGSISLPVRRWRASRSSRIDNSTFSAEFRARVGRDVANRVTRSGTNHTTRRGRRQPDVRQDFPHAPADR